MFTKIGTVTVGVSDQDKALDFFVHKLGFEKVNDQPMSETERWLELALPGTQTHIILGLRGQSASDKTGMTGFVLHTDNIEETCATLKARGVTLTQELTTQPWGKWAQFSDLDDNEFGHRLGSLPLSRMDPKMNLAKKEGSHESTDAQSPWSDALLRDAGFGPSVAADRWWRHRCWCL